MVLARDGTGGTEVFLGQRPEKSTFGTAYVFPGGVVDPEDQERVVCSGVSEDQANGILSLSCGGLGYYAAAVRETFEETGVSLRCDQLHYFSHWITPEMMPKRYSTRFFAAKLPEGQHATHCGEELLNSTWITAAEALRANRDGRLSMAYPTIRTLQSIRDLGTVQALLAWADARAAAGIEAICPRMPPSTKMVQ